MKINSISTNPNIGFKAKVHLEPCRASIYTGMGDFWKKIDKEIQNDTNYDVLLVKAVDKQMPYSPDGVEFTLQAIKTSTEPKTLVKLRKKTNDTVNSQNSVLEIARELGEQIKTK